MKRTHKRFVARRIGWFTMKLTTNDLVLASIIAYLAPGGSFVVPTGPIDAFRSRAIPGRQHPINGRRGMRSQPSERRTARSASGCRRDVVRAMFSGIVEETGSVSSLVKNDAVKLWDGALGEGVELTVKAKTVLDGATEGCSIAVNGVCLTVTSFSREEFKVGLAPETLRRSNLGDLEEGDGVNLERALPVDGRNSGHFVQGHVDDVGTILIMEMDQDSLVVKVRAPQDLMRYIVPKGFISVDGTSLTVCEVNYEECWFSFMLVAYTQRNVIIPSKSEGDTVNLEVDVLGKYVERSLSSVLDRLSALEGWKKATELKLASMEGLRASDIDFKIGNVEHKVMNRDLILEMVESRLARLEHANAKLEQERAKLEEKDDSKAG